MTGSPRPFTTYDLNTARMNVGGVRREVLHECFAGADASEPDRGAAELIVGELLTNVAKYAPGPFKIRCGWDREGYAVFEIADRGRRFEVPPAKRDLTEAGGHGLRLVAALARSLSVRHEAGEGNVVRAVLPLRAA